MKKPTQEEKAKMVANDKVAPEMLSKQAANEKTKVEATTQTTEDIPKPNSQVKCTAIPKSFNELHQYAEQGDAKLEFALGLAYQDGIWGDEKVDRNFALAFNWFKKSAEQGYPRAEFAVGHCYMEGQGVARYPSGGIDWYQKASHHGNPDAQFALGVSYMLGEGVEKDIATGKQLLVNSAKRGNNEAIQALTLLNVLPINAQILDAEPGETDLLLGHGLNKTQAINAEALIHKYGFTVGKTLKEINTIFNKYPVNIYNFLSDVDGLDKFMNALALKRDLINK